MIYLIDDKKNRQEMDFGWSTEKLATVKDYLYPIYTLKELEEKANEVFKEGNTVLYHESFLDGTSLKNESSNKRKLLDDFAHKHSSFNLVLFSGSKNVRKLEGNVAHIPVSVVYQYLKHFIDKYSFGDKKLGYLVYGKNPEIENELLDLLERSLSNIEQEPAEISGRKNLFVETYDRNIKNAIKDAARAPLFGEENDSELAEFIRQNLANEPYDNIFIPLCFGNTLSDYNGLRLATLIRCIESPNRLSRVFIYGVVGVEYVFQHVYFNILKTKNVQLIAFSKAEFERRANSRAESFENSELPLELSKLKLDLPKNYDDNHSIANEWAIYRWATSIGATDLGISLINNKFKSDLYFKYLQTIYPIQDLDIIEEGELKIKAGSGIKILYIDDEADKGWYEILCKIIYDINKIDFDYIGDDLKGLAREQIIKRSLDRVKQFDADIVILDFRLHPDDFKENDLNAITGLRLLSKIKECNPGVQVIVFSATNKIWSLEAMQNANADRFVIKGSVGNSNRYNVTHQTIYSFRESLNRSLKRVFLKQIFSSLSEIRDSLNRCEYIDQTDYHYFVRGLTKQLEVIEGGIKKIDLEFESTLDIVFLCCYNFLEQFKNEYYLKYRNNQYLLGINEIEMNRYSPLGNEIARKGLFVPLSSNDKPSWFNTLSALVIDYFEICGHTDSLVIKLNRIKDKRNDFIHNKKLHFDQNEIKMIIEVMAVISKNMKE